MSRTRAVEQLAREVLRSAGEAVPRATCEFPWRTGWSAAPSRRTESRPGRRAPASSRRPRRRAGQSAPSPAGPRAVEGPRAGERRHRRIAADAAVSVHAGRAAIIVATPSRPAGGVGRQPRARRRPPRRQPPRPRALPAPGGTLGPAGGGQDDDDPPIREGRPGGYPAGASPHRHHRGGSIPGGPESTIADQAGDQDPACGAVTRFRASALHDQQRIVPGRGHHETGGGPAIRRRLGGRSPVGIDRQRRVAADGDLVAGLQRAFGDGRPVRGSSGRPSTPAAAAGPPANRGRRRSPRAGCRRARPGPRSRSRLPAAARAAAGESCTSARPLPSSRRNRCSAVGCRTTRGLGAGAAADRHRGHVRHAGASGQRRDHRRGAGDDPPGDVHRAGLQAGDALQRVPFQLAAGVGRLAEGQAQTARDRQHGGDQGEDDSEISHGRGGGPWVWGAFAPARP